VFLGVINGLSWWLYVIQVDVGDSEQVVVKIYKSLAGDIQLSAV